VKTVLWSLALVNAAAAASAFFVSIGVAGSVKDVLQVLGGCSLLTVVGLLYLIVSKLGPTRGWWPHSIQPT